MILKSIKIKNFRSYYGENIFELSEGLTLIIGGNGDGKTTFFEALEWLFNTSIDDKNESNISAKRKSELEIGERDEVSVAITFEHNGEKELEKSFTFERADKDNIRPKDFKFIGYKTNGSERQSEQGKNLLEQCFDTVIRRYCLFKGESELNVFNSPAALKTLVETFSGIKQFDDLVNLTTEFESKSNNAVNKEMLNDTKCERKTKELNNRSIIVSNAIQNLKKDIQVQEEAVSNYTAKLAILEKNQEATEQYQVIKDRIKALSDKRATLKNHTNLDYNALLLDESWILRSFPKVLDEYQKKVSALSREKRSLDKKETERRAAEKGKIEALESLAKGVTSLTWDVPDKETMQEMIDEEVCKVCGREAKKGSDAYNFMVNRLNNYIAHIAQEAEKQKGKSEDKPLFPNNYINELSTRRIKMSGEDEQRIAAIATEISDRLTFVFNRKKDLEKIEKELQEAEDEKSRLLIQAQGLTEDMLEKSFSDFKGFCEQQGRAEKRITELKFELQQKEADKKEIEEEFAKIEPTNTSVKIYQRVHTALSKIMKAFINAKNKNVTDFLYSLEKTANEYLVKLNENDFHGIIQIIPTIDDSARIELKSKDGSYISNPSDSQKTTMYMSILFAISEITTLKRDQDYPLIFDAPTSNMDGFKANSYYNVIDKINKQCIIVTKDLLIENKTTGTSTLDEAQIDQLTCSVYRISKATNYNQTELSTIQTTTTKIK